MLKEQSPNQTVLEFYLPFGGKLNPDNRWVKLASLIPWEALGSIYNKQLNSRMGAPAKPSRVVIGAMILKHMKDTTDEEIIEDIRENPYYQYFLGFTDFQDRVVFVPSLFVEIRKRLGMEQLQEINELFLSIVSKDKVKQETKGADSTSSHSEVKVADKEEKDKARVKNENEGEAGDENEDEDETISGSSSSHSTPTHKGMLIIDATVAPSDIRYPTDVDLLNTGRMKAEGLIDVLWSQYGQGLKPRTYRRKAHKQYLAFTHQRKPGKGKVRKAIRTQLGYLSRDLKHIETLINKLLEGKEHDYFPLSYKDQRTLWIISELYRQQKWMYDNKVKSIEGRIVSIAQPHVRPIVRGKAGKRTEFGAKISGVVIDGRMVLDNLSWEAYNESLDMAPAIEKYHKRFGYYPESVNADKIYWNRKNRKLLKEKGINLFGASPLGRPRKVDKLSPKEKQNHLEQSKRRNWIEAKFGEGKRKYGLGLVMTKTQKTSESWIAMVIWVMNLAKELRDFFLPLLFQRFWKQFMVNISGLFTKINNRIIIENMTF